MPSSSICASPIFPSLQHHVSYPIKHLEESSFEEGFGMDGSSIRGWAAINESDMLLIPRSEDRDHGSVRRDPHAGHVGRRDRSDHQAALRARSALDRSKRPNCTSRTAASATPPISARKPSSSFSTTSVSTRISTPASTSSTPKKAAGIPAASATTSVTGRATRKATSRFRPPIIIRICAARWSRP